jgi:hypothetical protein
MGEMMVEEEVQRDASDAMKPGIRVSIAQIHQSVTTVKTRVIWLQIVQGIRRTKG